MIITNKRWIWLCALAMVAGCTTDVREGAAPGVQVRDSRAPQAGIRYNTVVIVDKSLQNWDGKVFDPPWAEAISAGPKEENKRSKIAVESTNSRRTATGTLEVWAILRNRTDFPLQIEGRTQFFDEAKAPAEGPTAWKRLFLPPQSVATYREYSTKVEGIGFYYVEIREGR
jgi:hypothetical protein